MKTRLTGYRDYGFDDGEEKELKKYCKSHEFDSHRNLWESAVNANRSIAVELFVSIAKGLSYEDICKSWDIPLPKADFYGYQRKCLSTLRNFLIFEGKWQYESANK